LTGWEEEGWYHWIPLMWAKQLEVDSTRKKLGFKYEKEGFSWQLGELLSIYASLCSSFSTKDNPRRLNYTCDECTFVFFS
jgi:hypothetical protein